MVTPLALQMLRSGGRKTEVKQSLAEQAGRKSSHFSPPPPNLLFTVKYKTKCP